MSTYTTRYEGDFGGVSAGENGLDTQLTIKTGSALPNNANIVSITYSISLSADKYSSSHYWELHHFYLGNGSPYAPDKSVSMSSTKGTISGTMTFSQNDVSLFGNSVRLYAKANTTHSSTSYMKNVSVTVMYTIGYDTSSFILSGDSVDAGNSIDLEVSNSEISSVYHKIEWSCGSRKETEILDAGVAATSFFVPQDWCNEIVNTVSASATVTVETLSLDGTSYGTQTKTFLINVPSDIVPTIKSIIATRIDNDVPTGWNEYIQNRSGVTLSAEEASSQYGASIVSYTFTGVASGSSIFAVTQIEAQTTLSPVQDSGTIFFSVYATDSRGRRSSTATTSISVREYYPPTIDTALAFRCLSTGEANEEGTYISVQMNSTYYSMNGKNAATLKCEYHKNGEENWNDGQVDMKNNTAYVIGDGLIDTQYTYQVRFTISDAFTTVTRTVGVLTSTCTMFFRNGGTGIGLGKVCERDYAVEINPDWRLYLGDTDVSDALSQLASVQIPNIVYTTGSSPSNPVEGMIWLKKK